MVLDGLSSTTKHLRALLLVSDVELLGTDFVHVKRPEVPTIWTKRPKVD